MSTRTTAKRREQMEAAFDKQIEQMRREEADHDAGLRGGGGDQTAAKDAEPRFYRNWRVEYVAPTKPEHTFEPRCWIMADTELGSVRVFDVPDPDEDQRAVAELTCRAMESHAALVAALEKCVNLLQVATLAGNSLYASPVRKQAQEALQQARGGE